MGNARLNLVARPIMPRAMDATPTPIAPTGWRQRLWTEQGWLLALAGFFVLLAPALAPFDAACAAAADPIFLDSGQWLRDLIALVRPLGHGEVLLLIGLAFGAAGRRLVAVEALLGLIIVGVLVWVLKIPVDRIRPTGEHYSFPSGDAATCAVLIPVLWHCGARGARWFALGGLLLTVAVAAARVIKGFHFPSDVAAGSALGVLGGVAAHALMHLPRLRALAQRLGSRWYLAGTIITLAIALFAAWQKYRGGDPNPLLFSLLAGMLPLFVLLVAVPRLRAADRVRTSSWQGPATWLIALGIASLLAFGATRSSLWDRDETFYAETAQEMLRSGEYLVPSYNGEPFLHKPPLIYWLMAGSAQALGPTPFAFRIWSCLALIGILTSLGWLATRLIGAGNGPRLALLFATMPLLLVSGGAATTDALLLLSVIVAMLPWLAALASPTPVTTSSWPRALLMGLGMGVGMLTKAPLGIAVPVASLVFGWLLLRLAARRDRAQGISAPLPPPLLRDLAIATVIGLGFYLAWAIPTNLATHGELVRVGLGKHVLGRALAPMESHGGPLWKTFPYYAVVVLVACLPWTAYLPAALSGLASGRLGDRKLRITVLAWFLPTFVAMTLAATKLPHYILPALPAVALAVTAVIAAAAAGTLDPRELRLLRAGRWLLAGLFVPLGIGLLTVPWFLPLDDPRPSGEAMYAFFRPRHAGIGLGLVFLAIPLLVWKPWLTRPALAARLLAAGMLTIMAGAAVFLMPTLEAFKPSQTIGERIHAATPDDVVVTTAGFDEPSIICAINRAPVANLDDAAALRTWADDTAPGVLVTTTQKLAEAGIALDRPGLTLLDQRRGFNYSRGKWLDLVTLGRHLPRPTPPAAGLP